MSSSAAIIKHTLVSKSHVIAQPNRESAIGWLDENEDSLAVAIGNALDDYLNKLRSSLDIAWLRNARLSEENERLLAEVTRLNTECERAWGAFHIAHDQAVDNGSALQASRAELADREQSA